MPMWQRGDSARGRAGSSAKRRPIAKFAFRFGSKTDTDGDGTMKQELGGKGAGLAEMSRIGLDVPAGFTLSTDLCALYAEADKEEGKGSQLLRKAGVWREVDLGVKFIEKQMRRQFPRDASTKNNPRDASTKNKGDELPLLLSVRSGAAVSMPGMMDTVLNLGLNDDVVERFITAPATSEPERRFCLDAYRRLLDMFGDVVLAIPREDFERVLTEMKRARGVATDAELTASDLRELIDAYKRVYVNRGKAFPADPETQLRMSIEAVLASWNNPRAVKYREINKDCAGLKGTAVNVQAMAFGNRDDNSCSGVLFTRDPSTGEKKLYGEYLVNAQGEDVVAGIRTPENIAQLAVKFPRCHKVLVDWCDTLENHFWDVMDVEFTVESDKLWILQCRSGKRIGAAAVKIACDMVDEGLITVPRAVLMVEPRHLDQLLRPRFDPKVKPSDGDADVVAKGLPASPGAAVGTIVFTAADAEAAKKRGVDCILIRVETSAEDVGGMNASSGILTARGGMTSHAAVVARGWGKPCVVGCGEMFVNERDRTVKFQGCDVKFKEGDAISLDGDEGLVIRGSRALIASIGDNGHLARVMRWADEIRRIKVLANADTPADAAIALVNGAEGIGLVRTEHQFFSSPERLRAMRSMVLAFDDAARTEACDRMLPFQREDFEGIFTAMAGLSVCVRLLDPPLHEFLPPRKSQELDRVARDVASDAGEKDVGKVLARAEMMREMNPMLGMRGCRLGIQHPSVTAMQSRAIFEAAKACAAKGIEVKPQIMVPLVATAAEFSHQANVIRKTSSEVFAGAEAVPFEVGAMVETPRAALVADDLVRAGAQFLSLGTNDLTQMTFGFSRDDVGPILKTYRENGILADDPFERIDELGVGLLIENCAATSRAAVRELNEQWQEDQSKPKGDKTAVKIGVCGEHGGDPASVGYFASDRVALDYVSCSAHRVIAARLAAAQAAARELAA